MRRRDRNRLGRSARWDRPRRRARRRPHPAGAPPPAAAAAADPRPFPIPCGGKAPIPRRPSGTLTIPIPNCAFQASDQSNGKRMDEME